MTGDLPVISQAALRSALLERQLLLRREPVGVPEALERIGGIQMQYAPSGYVGLWTRLDAFRRDALTEALERREAVQGTLMRTTIHLVSAREYWLFTMGVRKARQQWWLRVQNGAVAEAEMERGADRVKSALASGPRSVAELGDLMKGFLGSSHLWVDIVRVPPSGTWQRRRADVLALAEDWVGPNTVTAEEGTAHLVRSYLRGFGPAPLGDIATWAGVPVGPLKAAIDGVAEERFRDEAGKPLLDLPDAPAPDPDVAPPIRLLPHWDANLLVHVRRTGILPEEFRPRVFSTKNPFSVGTYLVDGRVAGAWSLRDGRVVLDEYRPLPKATLAAVRDEADRLEAFHAA